MLFKGEVALFKGEVALITGAASGIGQAAARLFAQQGSRVVIADIDAERGRRVEEGIKADGNDATFVCGDAGLVGDMEGFIKVAVQTYGQLNIFWHNAGIVGPGSIDSTTEEEYDRTMAVNLKAGVFGAKLAIPHLRKAGGGCIMFTSSVSGLRSSSSASLTYSLTKAGLVMLTMNLAVSLAKENIRVNCICPGPVRTPAMIGLLQRAPDVIAPEALEKLILGRTPVGRWLSEEEIAYAGLFLASSRASAITGVALPVDGGYTAA